MDLDLRDSMRRYYDERASEYEEAYLLGTGTASIPDPEVFRREVSLVADAVDRFASGRLIDLACGTGYWLRFYAAHCSSITLIDQSPRMLDECRKKVMALNVASRTTVILGDVFEHAFTPRAYDAALIGFLISHLSEGEEQQLFDRLKALLSEGGRFLILDSAWSLARARFNTKVGRQQRRLNDGTSFEIYKRYIDRQDILDWTTKYDVAVSIEHFGNAFVVVSGHLEV
jgi:ubiquinone/menaquinone biosynthesis C-methylase UbiE